MVLTRLLPARLLGKHTDSVFLRPLSTVRQIQATAATSCVGLCESCKSDRGRQSRRSADPSCLLAAAVRTQVVRQNGGGSKDRAPDVCFSRHFGPGPRM